MVERTCAKCATVLRLDDKYKGKTIACPKCKGVISPPDSEKDGTQKPAEKQPAAPDKTEQAANPNLLVAVVSTGIGVVVVLLIVLILVFSFRNDDNKPGGTNAGGTGIEDIGDEEGASAKDCAANLEAIYTALEKYRDEHNTVPGSLAALVDKDYLPDRDATLCNLDPYVYRSDSFLYNNLGIEPSELLVTADSIAAHGGKRQALFRDGSVELITEREFKRFQRELVNAVREVQQREADARQKAKLENEAARVYEKFRAAGSDEIESTLEDLRKLKTAYVETQIYREHKEEIEAAFQKLQFKSRLFGIHRFIEDAKLAEVRGEYSKLQTEFPDRVSEIAEEVAALDAYEKALKLRAEGKLTEARDEFGELMKKPGTAWKRHANRAIMEIDAYIKRAEKLFSEARNAEAKGNVARAFTIYFRICRDYPASAQCKAATEARDKLVDRMTYGPRFRDKAGFFDDKEKKKGFQASIESGLKWLAARQDKEGGGFDADAFAGANTLDPGDSDLDIAVTALALLAFLGEGSTHLSGVYEKNVAAGVNFLLGKFGDDGVFGNAKAPHAALNQVMATLALAEAANMTGDVKIVGAVKKAVRKIMALQHSGMGWPDGPLDGSKKEDSTILTCWTTIALFSAKNLGIDVHGGVFGGARNWLFACTDRESGLVGTVPVEKAKPQKPGVAHVPLETAAATLARFYIAGTGAEISSEIIDSGLEVLFKSVPDWDKPDARKVNFCYWYFGLMALAQEQLPQYRSWRWALGLNLVDNQVKDGEHAGSWPDPVKQRTFAGGRVWSTAMAVLILQNPYNRLGGKLHPRVKKVVGKIVTLVLADDTYITGELVEETTEWVTIKITRGRATAEQKYERKDIKQILPGEVEKPK
ncbi:MAG: prenyltransferase/squalene oxidase repeat-containing protein [Planctomycetota bacterium]|jgi:hypothetical protein